MSTLQSPFVKFCGITNLEDADFACTIGASAIGFIAYKKSKRYIQSADVDRIISYIAKKFPKVKLAGVFVNSEYDTIMKYIESGINIIQLHGNETVKYLNELKKTIHSKYDNVELWRAIRLKTEKDLSTAKKYSVDKYLVDSFVEDNIGGTGISGDWDLAKIAVKTLSKPVILAGGLTPNNVGEAIKIVNPFGVDVSSGVENSPGIKNHRLLKEFIAAIQVTSDNSA